MIFTRAAHLWDVMVSVGSGRMTLLRRRADQIAGSLEMRPVPSRRGVSVWVALTGAAVLVLLAAAAFGVFAPSGSSSRRGVLVGIHKIRHVVVVMQENRSFDSYFGTFPGADGILPGVCLPDPANGGCVRPFHDRHDMDAGGPHG